MARRLSWLLVAVAVAVTSCPSCSGSTFGGNVPVNLPRNNLLGLWDAANTSSNPGSGSTWFDISGNGYHATLQNANNAGSTVVFSGAVVSRGLTSLPRSALGQSYTLCARAALTSITGTYNMLFGAGSTLSFGRNSELPGQHVGVQDGVWLSTLAVPQDAWNGLYHTFCLRMDRKAATVWLDGALLTPSPVYSAGYGAGDPASVLAIGCELDGAGGQGFCWNGPFRGAAVYSRALSALELAQVHAFFAGTTLRPLHESSVHFYIDSTNPASYPGTGTAVTDLSTARRSVTLTDGATGTGGLFNFVGGNSRADTTMLVNSFDLGTYTIMFRARMTSVTGTYNAFVGSRNPSGTGTTFFIGRHSGAAQLGIQDGDYNSNVGPFLDLADGAFHVVAVTRAVDRFTVYIDGHLVYVSTASSSTLSTEVFVVGTEVESTGFGMVGSVSQVAIWTRRLTAQEMFEVIDTWTPGSQSSFSSGLLFHYDARNAASNDGVTPVLSDLSGNGAHATLVGSPTQTGGHLTVGQGKYVLTPTLRSALSATGGFTALTLIRVDTTNTVYSALFGSNVNPSYFFWGMSTASGSFHLQDSFGSGFDIGSHFNLTDGTYHMAAIYVMRSSHAQMYSDGIPRSIAVNGGLLAGAPADQLIRLASENEGTPNYFWNGHMDVFMMWNRKLTGPELEAAAWSALSYYPGSVDLVAPTTVSLTLAVTPGGDRIARAGDQVVVTFVASEPVQAPTVLVGGSACTLDASANGGVTWVARLTVGAAFTSPAADAAQVSVSVAFSDLAGNAGATAVAPTDGQHVRVDRTPPTRAAASSVTVVGKPSGRARAGDTVRVVFTASEPIQTPAISAGGVSSSAPTSSSMTVVGKPSGRARAGDTVRVVFTASEPIQTPAISAGGVSSSAPTSSNGGATWTADVSVSTGSPADTAGLQVTVTFTDLAGNAAASASVETSSVVVDTTAPSFQAGGSPSAAVATSASSVTMTATLNENGRLFCAATAHAVPAATFTSAEVKAAAQAPSFPANGLGAASGAGPFLSGGWSVAASTSPSASVAGLLRASVYDVYCVAEDAAPAGKLRVLEENLQGSPTVNTVFTGGCLEGNATVVVPTLNLAGTSISGSNLVLALRSSRHFAATRLAFVGASAAANADCSMQAEVNTGSQPAENEWAYSADSLSCNDAWTFTRALTSVLAECGFAEQGSTAEFTEYRATLEATTVENGSNPVFGVGVNRTERTAVVMGVRVPNLANVTNNASVFGAAIPITATTTQVFDTVNRNFSFVLATSVQHPYELFVDPAATTSGEGGHTVYGAVAENDCASAGSGECLQRFAIGLRPGASACTVNSLLTTTFRVRCRASFGGACDAPSLSQFTAAFQVTTDNFCARVVEIGAVTPSLEVYDSEAARNARLAQTTDAVTSSLLFYRVDLVLEAGLQATSLNLTDVRIRSFCAEPCEELAQPVANGAVAPNAFADYAFQITSQAGSRADFQFQINDNSISFDNDDPSGSVNVQVTVGAVVNYTTPSGQKLSRRVELLAAAGGGSAAVSASAQFGASGGPAAPASVSGESTVLGMTQGTALVAGVGLVAIVALAAGAAVVARRRRQQQQSSGATAAGSAATSVRLFASSSQDDVLAAKSLPLDDLRVVQTVYDQHA